MGPHHVVTTEQTAKKWKMLKLIAAILLVFGIFGIIGASSDPEIAKGSTGMLATCGVMTAVGLILAIYAKFGAWWHHG